MQKKLIKIVSAFLLFATAPESYAAEGNEANSSVSKPAAYAADVAQSSLLSNAQSVVAQSNSEKGNLSDENTAGARTKTNKSYLLLQGQVSNREKLQPVDAEFRTGASVDLTKLRSLKQLSADNHWDRIPAWAAGEWAEKTVSLFYKYSFAMKTRDCSVDTYMAKSSDHHGLLKDKVGDIWQYRNKNYFAITEFETQWGIDYVKDAEVLETDQQCMVMRFVSIKFNVDKYNKRIISNRQVESIQTYTPYGSNLIKVVSSQKIFDEDGTLLTLAKLLGFDVRVHPFTPRPNYKGKDMQKLFAEYLSSNGMASLIPARL